MNQYKELKEAGLRPTLSRLTILELFSKEENQHLTAEAIHRLLEEKGNETGLATIYRILTQFEHAGILLRHKHQDSKAVYELAPLEHHDHMICLKCNKMFEFSDPIIEERKKLAAEMAGFKLVDHLLYLYVECTNPHCPNL
ncbi:MAG: ferric iron uptake transcriptional regulator [Magnetococcales bacterium]|nr:ferric iron uptake transcriptional regulator [Magnetococcales bacterium]